MTDPLTFIGALDVFTWVVVLVAIVVKLFDLVPLMEDFRQTPERAPLRATNEDDVW
jgi:hypothetical protein